MSKLLAVQNLSMRFGGVTALSNISFDIQLGEVLSLVGPNGAGKTTVLNMISRIGTPTVGSITYHGTQGALQLTAQPPHRMASLGIARTFQTTELYMHASVLQNLLIGRHAHRGGGFWQDIFFSARVREAERLAHETIEKTLDFLGLQRYRDCLVAALPYGVRKVVELARALCMEPRLLLLDEPSSGLNAREAEAMAGWILHIKRHWGITVLMAEHNMALASLVSDRVLVLNEGEALAMGTPSEVQTRAEVVEAYRGSSEDVSPLRRKDHAVQRAARIEVPTA